jgi:hypothetical protein
MKKLTLTAALATAMLLGSCAQMSTGLGGLGISAGTIAQIQATSVVLCGFKPAIDMVLALVTANPAVAVVDQLATAICATAVPKPALRRAVSHSRVVIPPGFKAQGTFVR